MGVGNRNPVPGPVSVATDETDSRKEQHSMDEQETVFVVERNAAGELRGTWEDGVDEDGVASALRALMESAVERGLDPNTIQARFMAQMIEMMNAPSPGQMEMGE